MTTKEPQLNLNDRLELKAAAEVLSVSKGTVLRYTKQGLLHAGIKKSNGRRFWLGSEIIRFWRASI